ncbi:MAG: sn-glycerol-1-phosphate dehydrogenase, partial [Acutalibacteraceae bacterium]
PASGVEHYFSHIWDMREVEFGTFANMHGIQCGVGTVYSAKIYDFLRTFTPDKEKALKFVSEFDYNKRCGKLREFLGNSSEAIIALEEKEQKYNIENHKKRLDAIINNWDKIIKIINEEMPTHKMLRELFNKAGMQMTAEEIGIDKNIVAETFETTKDIRDKYIVSRLMWDLGISDEAERILNS